MNGNGSPVGTWGEGTAGPVKALAWAHGGKALLVASGDHTLRLYDEAHGALMWAYEMPSGWHGVMAIAPDGQVLALGDDNGNARLARLGTAAGIGFLYDALPVSRPYPIVSIAFAPAGSYAALCRSDGLVLLWHAWTGEVLATLRLSTTEGKVLSVAFSPAGTLLAGGSNGGFVQLWRVEGGNAGDTLQEQSGVGEALTLARGVELLRNMRPFLSPAVDADIAGELNRFMGIHLRVEAVGERSVSLVVLEEGRYCRAGATVGVPSGYLTTTYFQPVQEG
jgi:WD40 repeat protein